VYSAIVHGQPRAPTGRVKNMLVEYADGTVHVTSNPVGGEQAISDYKVIRSSPSRSWVRVKLYTGKKHQIRVHMAELRCPIVGDPIYGIGRERCRMMLAAVELAFDHPRTGKRMQFKIEPPDEFGTAMKVAPRSHTKEHEEEKRNTGRMPVRRKNERQR
jgi:23S rRNA pseudouridine1911/1915/1917 synthase